MRSSTSSPLVPLGVLATVAVLQIGCSAAAVDPSVTVQSNVVQTLTEPPEPDRTLSVADLEVDPANATNDPIRTIEPRADTTDAKYSDPPASLDAKYSDPPASLDAKYSDPPASLDAKYADPPGELDTTYSDPPACRDGKYADPPGELDAKYSDPPACLDGKYAAEAKY